MLFGIFLENKTANYVFLPGFSHALVFFTFKLEGALILLPPPEGDV